MKSRRKVHRKLSKVSSRKRVEREVRAHDFGNFMHNLEDFLTECRGHMVLRDHAELLLKRMKDFSYEGFF